MTRPGAFKSPAKTPLRQSMSSIDFFTARRILEFFHSDEAQQVVVNCCKRAELELQTDDEYVEFTQAGMLKVEDKKHLVLELSRVPLAHKHGLDLEHNILSFEVERVIMSRERTCALSRMRTRSFVPGIHLPTLLPPTLKFFNSRANNTSNSTSQLNLRDAYAADEPVPKNNSMAESPRREICVTEQACDYWAAMETTGNFNPYNTLSASASSSSASMSSPFSSTDTVDRPAPLFSTPDSSISSSSSSSSPATGAGDSVKRAPRRPRLCKRKIPRPTSLTNPVPDIKKFPYTNVNVARMFDFTDENFIVNSWARGMTLKYIHDTLVNERNFKLHNDQWTLYDMIEYFLQQSGAWTSFQFINYANYQWPGWKDYWTLPGLMSAMAVIDWEGMEVVPERTKENDGERNDEAHKVKDKIKKEKKNEKKRQSKGKSKLKEEFEEEGEYERAPPIRPDRPESHNIDEKFKELEEGEVVEQLPVAMNLDVDEMIEEMINDEYSSPDDGSFDTNEYEEYYTGVSIEV